MTCPPEQAASFIHSLSSTFGIGDLPEDYAATPTIRQHVHESGPSPFTGVFSDISSSSTGLPFNSTGVDLSYPPEFAANTLLSDFDITVMVPAQASPIGSSVLEELGLGEGWQPVMDDLGL
jgi:hypothetical protein